MVLRRMWPLGRDPEKEDRHKSQSPGSGGAVAEEWPMQKAEKGWVQMPGKGESTWSRDHTTQGQELF